ncbi:hypothetical protein GCM10007382_04060 [Salinibacterium xinjiangense]|nr:hypothetical protein GCM10007382_04060 [Salinibacterium xinjiangense]
MWGRRTFAISADWETSEALSAGWETSEASVPAGKLARRWCRGHFLGRDHRAYSDTFNPAFAVDHERGFVGTEEHSEGIRRLARRQPVPHDDPHARRRDGYHEPGA